MSVTASKPARRSRPDDTRWLPYLFAGPLAVYLLLFQGYPLVQELLLSFTDTSLLSPQKHAYVGLDNYRDLVEGSDFQSALWITAIYTISCVVIAIGIGLRWRCCSTARSAAVASAGRW